MSIIRRRGLLAGAGLASFMPGASAQAARERPQSLLIAGAPAIRDLITALGDAFREAHPGVTLHFEACTNATALLAVRNGATDLAAITSDLPADTVDERWHAWLVARNGVQVIAHPGIAAGGAALQPLAPLVVGRLISGAIVTWRELGGADLKVRPVLYLPGTPERYRTDAVLPGRPTAASSARVVGNAADMVAAVLATPGAMGLLGFGDAPGGTVALPCQDVAMDRTSLLSGRYPLTGSALLVSFGREPPLVQAFVQFARGPAGQAIAGRPPFVRIR